MHTSLDCSLKLLSKSPVIETAEGTVIETAEMALHMSYVCLLMF